MKKHVLSQLCRMLSPYSYDRPLLRMGWLRLLAWLISSAMLSGLSLAVEASVTIRYVDQLPAEPGSAWDGVDGAAYVGTLGEGKGYSTIIAAIAAMSSGDHIILRGGTYVEGHIVLPSSKDGTSWDEGCYNRMASYPGEWAVLDGENNLPNTHGNVAVMGNIISCAYWKFERLEICNGRRADGDRAHGFYADKGPFIFRFCYIHDNNCENVNDIPGGIVGHRWRHCVVEYCYFKDNGALNTPHWNASHITIYSDYKEERIAKYGFAYDGNHTMKNTIRYNRFEGGGSGLYLSKGNQYFTGRNLDSGNTRYSDEYKDYGDKAHHNIFINMNNDAICYNEDFIQIFNNIVLNCAYGFCKSGKSTYKTAIFNNTVIDCEKNGVSDRQWDYREYLYDSSDPDYPGGSIDPEPMYYGFVYNNIVDNCAYTMPNQAEEISLVSVREEGLTDEYKIDHCYSYRPHSHNHDPAGDKMIYLKDTRYTIDEFKALRPGVELWMNDYDANNELYQGTSGAAQYKTRGEHVLSGSTTIANGGIGGAHPYLDGVVMPSYIGATNPSDNAWVDGVLGLADLSNLKNGGPGDPSWIEGGSGNHAPEISPIGARSVPVGEQLQFTVEATDADGDGLQFSATGGSK